MIFIYSLLGVWVLWVFYLALMNLQRHYESGEMPILIQIMAWTVLVPGLVIDVVVNATLGWLVFFEPPKEWLLTQRLQRYIASGEGKRYNMAHWICTHFLNPFDPDGNHCD